MSSNVNIEKPRRPGRPPSQQARDAIVRAACTMLQERGVTGITMEGVATLAGVGKPTVYRHFGDRHELAMAALMRMATPEGEAPGNADPMETLKQQLLGMAALFETPTGRFVTSLLASGHGDTEMSKAFRNHFVEQRRQQSRVLLQLAKDAGTLRPDTDVELALDQLYGPILYRLLMGHGSIDRSLVTRLLDQLLEGIALA